jgi:type I restriction enzyme, R subunit
MARNEAETRAELIDPVLAAAGWGQVDGSRVAREYVIAPGRILGAGRPQQRLIIDYLMLYRNRKLAVVEAKSEDKPLTEGLGQAKQYAEKLGVRFAYATNGLGFYEVDMETGVERPVSAVPSPEVLWQRTFASTSVLETELTDIPFESNGGVFGGRYYQDIAVEKVLAAISDGKDRVLLTLATGTGKTFVAFQIVWKLFQSRWTKDGNKVRRPRILFLADRNILANQAFNAFGAFPDDALVRISPADIAKKGAVPKNGSVFFTIFQTFMSGRDEHGNEAPYFGEYPPDFFDFIVVDECHRGGARNESSWRGILEYFSGAVQLGLTATPRRTENVDTYNYFGNPVYSYALKEGINDGFLTPFRVRQFLTNFDEYQYSPEDRVIAGEVDENHVYTEKDFNKRIVITAREAARVKVFMDLMNPYDKTLVFCNDQEHALLVRDLINKYKKVPDPNYCHRVTADEGAIGDQHLADFQDNEKSIPVILTTSQKLSTGVDALNIRNIVLLRTINSMVEFKQIIGRGTRLFEDKEYFTVYDFVKAHHLFSDPEWDGDPVPPEEPGEPKPPKTPGPEKPIVERPEKIRIELGEGKVREFNFTMTTTFWGPNGEQLTVEQFLKNLFGELPSFYKNEADLRRIWSDPLTRSELLTKLGEQGFSLVDLGKIQELISATESDLYDVLAYISFSAPKKTREKRATAARKRVAIQFSDRTRNFIDFVLDHYVSEGVEELDPLKLPQLLELKYGGLQDALKEIGSSADTVRDAFIDFQKFLYEESVA